MGVWEGLRLCLSLPTVPSGPGCREPPAYLGPDPDPHLPLSESPSTARKRGLGVGRKALFCEAACDTFVFLLSRKRQGSGGGGKENGVSPCL